MNKTKQQHQNQKKEYIFFGFLQSCFSMFCRSNYCKNEWVRNKRMRIQYLFICIFLHLCLISIELWDWFYINCDLLILTFKNIHWENQILEIDLKSKQFTLMSKTNYELRRTRSHWILKMLVTIVAFKWYWYSNLKVPDVRRVSHFFSRTEILRSSADNKRGLLWHFNVHKTIKKFAKEEIVRCQNQFLRILKKKFMVKFNKVYFRGRKKSVLVLVWTFHLVFIGKKITKKIINGNIGFENTWATLVIWWN